MNGTEALLRDVMAVPPDQQALGLAEAIQEQASCGHLETRYGMSMRLGVIQGNAKRLIALLERQDASAMTEQQASETGQRSPIYCYPPFPCDTLREEKAALLAVLASISQLGGNLPDDSLTDRTGPNDARQRGLMYTEARRIARAAIAKGGAP